MAWRCDLCREAVFDTFDEAAEHEKICSSSSSKKKSTTNNDDAVDLTSSTTSDNNNTESRTTILSPGTVESRNYNKTDKSKISDEIRAFISGTDGNNATLSFKSEFRTFFTIWMFITRLPSPSWIDLHPGFLMRGMCYFPVVGSVLSCMYAIVYDYFDVSLGLPSIVAAAISISVGLYITGCFHEDGLADSADGLGGGWSKSQVLKIMTDSRVGTFGCAAVSLFLFTKLQLLGSLGRSKWEIDLLNGGSSSGAGPAILVAQTLSRLSAPYLIRTRDYVAEVGPKSPFYLFMVEAKHIVSWPRVLFAAIYCFIISSMLYGQVFAMVLILAVLVMAHLAGNKGDYLLGGVMGDFLGGTICICEIVVLILIAAKDFIIDSFNVATDIIYSSENSGDLSSMILMLYGSDRIRPIFHLLCLMVVLKVYTHFVGPEDMYVRDEENKTEKKD